MVVRSTATFILIVGGISACSRGISVSTWSTVSMTFAPGILKIMSRMASFSARCALRIVPGNPIVRMSETESVTVPTSATRTGAPVCRL